MEKQPDLSKRQVRTVIAAVSLIAAGLAAYSAAASYETVVTLAVRFGLSLPNLTPIGLDGGLFGVIILNIALIWLGKPVWWLGLTSRLFAVAIVAANGAAGWPRPVGTGLRVAAPVLFIIIIEAAQFVLLHRSDDSEREKKRKRDERIPFARWILAPAPTFVIWRRKTLWTGSRLPQSAIDTELSVIRLAEFYGDGWRQEADADLVWMIQAGVNMGEVLERVRKLVSPAAGRRQSRAASPAGGQQPVPAAPASPAEVQAPVPAAEPAASIAEPGERTFDVLLAEARAYRDELARTGERLSKEKLRLRLTVGSGKALELLRVLKDEDPQDEARDGSEAAV
jgi:hypothetical protein